MDNTGQLFKVALDSMREGFDSGAGLRPFGAVVARNGVIVAKACNSCVRDCDPTAHAEINAIRMAAQSLDRLDLSDCVLIASAQPCPMCRGAAYHAGISKILYASCWTDYEDLFSDYACHKAISVQPDACTELSTENRSQAISLWDAYRRECVESQTQE